MILGYILLLFIFLSLYSSLIAYINSQSFLVATVRQKKCYYYQKHVASTCIYSITVFLFLYLCLFPSWQVWTKVSQELPCIDLLGAYRLLNALVLFWKLTLKSFGVLHIAARGLSAHIRTLSVKWEYISKGVSNVAFYRSTCLLYLYLYLYL